MEPRNANMPNTQNRDREKIRIYEEKNKECFISCSYSLIYNILNMTIKHATEGNYKLWGLMNEMLHSIFFTGYMNISPRLTPSEFFKKQIEIGKFVMKNFREPFVKYKSHFPTRTPFSILLNMMEVLYDTTGEVKEQLLVLLEKLKFPNTLHPAGNKSEHFYTLESTVICVCYSEDNPQRRYYGASLSCRTKNVRKILIDLFCLTSWHEYVSHAVMSFTVGPTGHGITFPESVRCQAYYRDWKNNVYKQRKPCLNCNELFNLEDAERHRREYPYGNCAETEGLSNLLINDQSIREKMQRENHTEEGLARLRDETKKRLKSSLIEFEQTRKTEKFSQFNFEDFQFYSPLS